MEDINLKVLEYDFRFALVSDDVSGLNMEKIQFYPTEKMTRLYSGVTDKNIRKINIEEPVLDGIKVLD